ncbi:hypothetical protein FACS189413_17310 [Bacteroidia bacterium]|nr:hypothetical protein FACS189413_17310 [Bacteroidia bacterium]
MELPSENQRIKEIISAKGLIPASFADKIQIDRATIINLLRGRTNKKGEQYYPEPSEKVLKQILQTYPDVNPHWLYRGIEPMYLSDKAQINPLVSQDLFTEKTSENPVLSVNEASVFEYRKENRVKTPEKPVQNIENQSFVPPKNKDKKVEQIIVFFSDGSCKSYLPSNPQIFRLFEE